MKPFGTRVLGLLRSVYSRGTVLIYGVDAQTLTRVRPRLSFVVAPAPSAGDQRYLPLMHQIYTQPEYVSECIAWGGTCYLACSDDAIIGFGWLTAEEHTLDGLGWHEKLQPGTELIHSCGVDPAFRGEGVYPALLSEIAHERLGSGVRQVLAEVDARNSKSIRGLDKVGFRPIRAIGWRRIFGRPHARERSLDEGRGPPRRGGATPTGSEPDPD